MAITQNPVVSISAAAAAKVKELLAQEPDGTHLRLFVSRGGCSGYTYGMTLDTEVQPGDQVVDQHGVRLLLDGLAVRLLRGAQIDYTRSVMGEGFTLRNPNAISTCGCGHSFTTAEDPGEADPCEQAQASGGGQTSGGRT
ncbi:MAG: iron-sulfur cluster assembly accessory protein [Armatimonadota bacterium]|nr:iron-sulfur cluster assembly accessory protein [Armatimonadota bacterium]